MRIKSVRLTGYRNFKDTEIIFSEKSLVIGPNDIGKTNLIYALRLLLDNTLSVSDIEPKETDFFAHEPTHELSIRILFDDIKEECVIAKMKEKISDDGQFILVYHATRDPIKNSLDYKIFAGKDESSLLEIDHRYYLKYINLKFIGSKRDLLTYIQRERKSLLQDSREQRTEKEIEADNILLNEIETGLDDVGEKVSSLSYVGKSTTQINNQLGELSYHHQGQQVVFDVGASSPTKFIDRLQLGSQIDGQAVVMGGDGRNNQIQFALWASRNKIKQDVESEPLEVSFFCIEEPEAHLHPHQQRKLSKFLNNILKGQVIITSHSPQIACEMSPSSIIRLYLDGNSSNAAGNGSSPFIESSIIEFGYRMDIISAETFFADVVFLVEGISEVLFYKALAKQVGIDLDRFNISILMVDGIGFKPYVSLLKSLAIPFVIRTDNDVFKIPNKDTFRLAGIQRAVEIVEDFYDECEEFSSLQKKKDLLSGFSEPVIPDDVKEYATKLCDHLENRGIFLAKKDLEHDMYTAIKEDILNYFDVTEEEDVVSKMQENKAVFMFDFIQKKENNFNKLAGTDLEKPLLLCKKIAEKMHGISTNARTTTDN